MAEPVTPASTPNSAPAATPATTPAAAATATPATPETKPEAGFLGVDTSKVDTAETPTEGASTARPEWHLEKYKTVEDQAKAYVELEKKLGKGTVADVPDEYDVKEVFEKYGMSWNSDEVKSSLTGELKDMGFNQKQTTWMLERYAEAQTQMLQQIGPPLDTKAEHNKLNEAHGEDKAMKMIKVVQDYAKSLPTVLHHRSPFHTASGVEALYDLITQARGPAIINSEDTAPSMGDIKSELARVVADPEYKRSAHLQQKAMDLAAKLPR